MELGDLIRKDSADFAAIQKGDVSAVGITTKTPVRMAYEAQAQVIQRQVGSLSAVQIALGLSGRKICQLLLIDPSAWSRWMKTGQNPPPSVWRSLQWYLMLQEKVPGLAPSYFLGRDGRSQQSELEIKFLALQGQFQKHQRRSTWIIVGMFTIIAILFGVVLLKRAI